MDVTITGGPHHFRAEVVINGADPQSAPRLMEEFLVEIEKKHPKIEYWRVLAMHFQRSFEEDILFLTIVARFTPDVEAATKHIRENSEPK